MYREALQRLSENGIRKRSVTKCFMRYFDVSIQTLKIRSGELVNDRRCRMKWKSKRQMTSFMSRLCDTLFNRDTTRVKRHSDYSTGTEEQRRLLKDKMMQKKQERLSGIKNVVFFGDGSFGPSTRGHNSIPKKPILKELSNRGPTILLDEYNTSKMCCCGLDELKTLNGRDRCHKTDDTVCSLLRRLNTCDRDALASLNMMHCALQALKGEERPKHLCRLQCLDCDE